MRRYVHGGQTGAKRAGWHGDFPARGSLVGSRSQSLLNQDRHRMRTPLTGASRLPYPPLCLPASCLRLRLPACPWAPARSASRAPGTLLAD